MEIDNDMSRKSLIHGVSREDVTLIDDASVDNLHKLAIKYSDAVIIGSDKLSDNLNTFIIESDKYVIPHHKDEEFTNVYNALYDELLEESEVFQQ